MDATWTNDKDEAWDFPRLVREELAQPINGVACGGTHRLIGLSMAVRACQREGKPVEGEYAQAAQRSSSIRSTPSDSRTAMAASAPAGSAPGDDDDIDRNVRTTGHQLEWLVYSLSDQQLRDWRTVRAVYFLTNLLYSNYDNEWDTGALSHAVHALAHYDERVFQPYDQQPNVASSSGIRQPRAPAATRAAIACGPGHGRQAPRPGAAVGRVSAYRSPGTAPRRPPRSPFPCTARLFRRFFHRCRLSFHIELCGAVHYIAAESFPRRDSPEISGVRWPWRGNSPISCRRSVSWPTGWLRYTTPTRCYSSWNAPPIGTGCANAPATICFCWPATPRRPWPGRPRKSSTPCC